MRHRSLYCIPAAALLAACVSDPVTPVATTPVYAPVAGTVVTSPGAVVTQQPAVVAVQPAVPMVVVPAQPMVVAGYRAGFGRITSINRIPDASHHEGSAAPVRRLSITMDDGTVQWVDTRAQLAVGDRVELTADQRIQFPVATR